MTTPIAQESIIAAAKAWWDLERANSDHTLPEWPDMGYFDRVAAFDTALRMLGAAVGQPVTGDIHAAIDRLMDYEGLL